MTEAGTQAFGRQTLGEEIANSVSHGIGTLAAAISIPVLVVTAVRHGTVADIVGVSIFGAAMVLLYLASTLYHAFPRNRAKQVFQVLDHSAIYLLIAGTYTPFTLGVLGGAWGWSLFGVIWALAVAAIVIKLAWIDTPRWLSVSIYLVMGWLCVVAIYPLTQALPPGALAWLFAGGALYSVGAVIYARKRPDPLPGVFGFHEIWHLFVMAASFSHWWMMMRYVLRATV